MLDAATNDGDRRNDALLSAPQGTCPALESLRRATGEIHQRLERRLDAVRRLSDPTSRAGLVRRYAEFHIPADRALARDLRGMAGLDFDARTRTPLLAGSAGDRPLPDFPAPAGRAEALGMLYVLEGSTLGGRFILRALAARGIADPGLAFLDPYGAETGTRWRGFLAVLARELRGDAALIADACRGAVRAFRHAEQILCEDAA